MSKYQLINELCESRIFRTRSSTNKFSNAEQGELFYKILLGLFIIALHPKTHSWGQEYASKTAAFGNFDFFRTSGTDLYILAYLLEERGDLSSIASGKLVRILRGVGQAKVGKTMLYTYLLRLERSLSIRDSRLKSIRRTVLNWDDTNERVRQSTANQLSMLIRFQTKVAEILPYLKVVGKGEPGRFGKGEPSDLMKVAAIAGAGLAGLKIGLSYDPNKKWSIFNDMDTELKPLEEGDLVDLEKYRRSKLKNVQDEPNIELIPECPKCHSTMNKVKGAEGFPAGEEPKYICTNCLTYFTD